MCRWLAYSGDPIALEEAIFKPKHSLIDQSVSSTMISVPTNGDGFGVGWYNGKGEPGIFRSIRPAWNDRNLREIAHHIESGLFLAHVRRTTHAPVQMSNCHPFRYGKWLFVHNGLIYAYDKIHRDLLMAIDPDLFPALQGSTDSELIFFLALTFGLEKGPIGALEKAIGLVEKLSRAAGIDHPIQMTIGVVDGKTLWGFRYSSEGNSRTLFYSSDISAMRELYPNYERLKIAPTNARGIASEPLSELKGGWNTVPESTAVVVCDGKVELLPFSPSSP